MSDVYVEMKDEPKNSVEIGQTAKKDFYLKSLKLYWGNNDEWGEVVERLFLIRDEVVRRINNG